MKDLLKLYSFESIHNTPEETALADWLCKWFDIHGITYERSGNNLYHLTKEGDSPILSAHIDQVETNGKGCHWFMSDEGIITGYNADWERTSLGADDKNGVWLILKTLESGHDVDFILSAGEEQGCLGIQKLKDEGVLDKYITADRYCIVMDRKGNNDMLYGNSSQKFCSTLAQDLCNFLDQDYTATTGGISDTGVISKYCEAVNMSTAYTGPHTRLEATDFNRLEEMKDDIEDVVESFVHFSTPPSVYNPAPKKYFYNDDDWYSDYNKWWEK